MSIKIDKFNNEIIPLWNEVQNVVNGIDETLVSDSYIENLAYLRKITAFLSEAMSCIDADFLPNAFLDSIKSYLSDIKSYLVNTRDYTNSSYISYTEDSLDGLLQIVFPFILHKGKATKGLRIGLNEYSKTINAHVENEFSEIKSIQESANKIKTELKNELDEFEALRTEIEGYRNLIFSEDGIKENIENLLSSSESKLSDIEKLHNSIYEEDGLKQEIDDFYSNISDKSKEINELTEDSSDTLQELSNFYDKIFGKDDENGKKVGGLKQEIDQRRSDLNELKKQIKSLLPGATSAGLSSAYNEMRNKFGRQSMWYGIGFYAALGALLITILYTREVVLLKDIPLDKGIWFSLLILLGNFAVKMPFIIPALWLVIFISRRRSEAERLSQEYAHKEVLAKSYDSYKQQIEKLSKKEQEELLPVLMEGMIKAISLNPAETLDKKHQSDSPISEVLKDKKFIDSIVDKIKGSSSKS
ncbi:hypothetical protein AOH328_00110 [Helicobacter pylori]